MRLSLTRSPFGLARRRASLRSILALLPLTASCAALGFRPTAGEGAPPSSFVRSVDTDSEKAVAVVTDPRFDNHESRRVDVASFKRAMTNSGLFTDEDVEFLGPPIAAELPEMGARDQVRVLAWAHDGIRRYYFYLHGGKMHVVYFRGDLQLDHHQGPVKDAEGVAAVTPTAAPAVTATAAPVASPIVTPAGGVPSPVASPTKTPSDGASAQAEGRAASGTTPRTDAPNAKTQIAAGPRLSEQQVREKIMELRSLQEQGLISGTEYKSKVKDTLNRL